jgi:signal transduction histidine kinase
MRVMSFGRPTIQAALLLGFGLVVGLWVYTGYEFTTRLAGLEEASASITRRYLDAQDRVTRIRSQLLVASVYVRDALLQPGDDLRPRYRRQLDQTYASIDASLEAYVPVLDTEAERRQVQRLRREIDEFRQMTQRLLVSRAQSVNDVRELLNRSLVPRREAAMRVSEEVQALNRAAFVQHQSEFGRVHRLAERRTWQQVGLALIASLAIGVSFSLYAGRLETRLQQQLGANEQTARELQHLSARLMTAQEDERRNIARELHDEVGQALTAVQVELTLAERRLAGGQAITLLGDAKAIAHHALQTVRDMSQLLHPAVLDDLGLIAAVEWQARSFEGRHGIRVEVELQDLPSRLPRQTEVAAYRIVQEALTNVAKHSGATLCRISLASTGSDLAIHVEDDGAGFEPGEMGERFGLGLVGIRERAALLAGQVALETARGRGTRVIARLPLGNADA